MSEEDPRAWCGHVPSFGTGVTFLSLPRLPDLRRGFPSHGDGSLLAGVQLLVAELRAGAGLRGECHVGVGCISVLLGGMGELLIPWGPMGMG